MAYLSTKVQISNITNGVMLSSSKEAQGFTLRHYTAIDADQDGIYEDYTLSLSVQGIPSDQRGSVIFVSPGGIEKRTGGSKR